MSEEEWAESVIPVLQSLGYDVLLNTRPVGEQPATFPLDLEAFVAGLDSPNHSAESRRDWCRLFFRDMQRAADSRGLDAAWAEAEAVLPKGWRFILSPWWPSGWEVEAYDIRKYEFNYDRRYSTGTIGVFDNPTAALEALAAALRKGSE